MPDVVPGKQNGMTRSIKVPMIGKPKEWAMDAEVDFVIV
jgi:hypothetical protein